MSVLQSISSVFSGGLGSLVKEAGDLIETYFPPDLSPEKKSALKLELERLAMQKQREIDAATIEAERALTERIAAHEGTASDLKALPIVGRLVLFLRGLQRPVWGFATLWLDWQWFTAWHGLTERQESALVVINLLVLGFLFGERAVKNVAPVLTDMFRAKRG